MTPTVDRIDVGAYTVPTEAPESDGTLEWQTTTAVVVEAHGGGRTGVGYTYCHTAAADLASGLLSDVVTGRDVLRPGAAWTAMQAAVRNVGRPGLAAEAISAVDIALWDLKARVLDLPLVAVLDAVHDTVPVYGSGGFTSDPPERVAEQLGGWVEAGIPRVKMKVGRDPEADFERLAAARDAIGPKAELYVDANGAYRRKQALAWATVFAAADVRWFEEPVSSDDIDGLRLLRDRAPAGMDIAAGEYGYTLADFRRLLAAGAVDCLQADVTRCGGISGFLRVAALTDAAEVDLSAHCAPQISAHACTAVWHLRHLEYFHDHVRVERLLFDDILEPQAGGVLTPDRDRPGNGLQIRRAAAERYRVR
jgi:L-alanine-DL-glutamate epimerase-like enolase superfamily enzyme